LFIGIEHWRGGWGWGWWNWW